MAAICVEYAATALVMDKPVFAMQNVGAPEVGDGARARSGWGHASEESPGRFQGTPMATLLVLHGPNLSLLGSREPGHYGRVDLDTLNRSLEDAASAAGHRVTCFQSNAEHALIERVHAAAQEGVKFIIINPAGYTHTSVALRDALLAVQIPFIEVHLSNVHAREPFRHHSYFSDVAIGVISGFGAEGYQLALQAAMQRLTNN